jgi:hypothetical protein
MEFHTYKLKEERSSRVVHYSINPEETKTEIEKLGHTVNGPTACNKQQQ